MTVPIKFEDYGRTEEEYNQLVEMWLWSAIVSIEEGSTGWTKGEFNQAVMGWLAEGLK